MDPVTAALLDVRSFVAEEPAREGAGLHFAVSQVRILDYIDSILAALPDDSREGLLNRTELAMTEATNTPDLGTVVLTREQWDDLSDLTLRYYEAAKVLRQAVAGVRALKLPDWLGKRTEEAWEATRDLMDPLDILDSIRAGDPGWHDGSEKRRV